MSDLLSRLSLQPVDSSDFEAMLALRVDAMRPSLERVGRFDPERSRERLSAGFVVPYMHHIVLDGEQRVGFVTLKPEGSDALRLDHLYLRTGFQGLGIGEWVLEWAKAQAREQQRDIALTALVKSDANRFYLRHGFVLEGEEGVDLHYRWRVASEAAC
ncbi:Acetyltransferase (GNAT) domain-containing protein [Variovorax sp. OK605]|uniref:GNAT family N-acetyltransferase n=1 Tax=unclassified Variovorax TaxID=663243 RepID=UPI0008AE7129|nr:MULTISPECIES: GNAT family N-acetyltransferase [unclassified Variovorax]SEK06311.1 Acetyltransferase (GNAT) domain-containing protein [Variovorax sp. OK202]SFD45924.1 Acetyltransferase (GNAT) domain-containing protein [Variovorax sp. OK212]SFO63486.1 Acetyltransferase (GNAT) domain-containing protein [Variovorax sp. OK605]